MSAPLKSLQSENTTFIYALLDPRTREIRYIGKADDPEDRLRKHLNRKRGKTHKDYWVNSLLAEGKQPILEIIDEVLQTEWMAVEAAYIQFYREEDCDLVNSSPGGDGAGAGCDHPNFGKKRSAAARAKQSEANRGKKRSLECRSKIGDANRRRIQSATTRTKISNANKGRKHSDEAREKMRSQRKGEKNWWLGRRHSAESRAKISVSKKGQNKGKQHHAEHCAKISAALKGREFSLEHRAKLSAAQTERIRKGYYPKSPTTGRWQKAFRGLPKEQVDMLQLRLDL